VKKFVALTERMLVDIYKVSFIDQVKHLEVHGPAHMKAKVIVDGNQVTMNENEVAALIDAMKQERIL
jgi:hypothetical protein